MAPASAIWRRVSFVGIPEDIRLPASPRSSVAEEPGSASNPMPYSARDQLCARRARRSPPDRRGHPDRPRRSGGRERRGPRGESTPPVEVVVAALEAGSVVYGVTTGFGSLADVRLTPEHSTALQHGLLRSHAVAVGDELSAEEVRAMLALRAHVLALGHSGVRREVVLRFVEMLERDLLPVVPEQGSLGASGDLAPLAHLALPVIGEGDVRLAGERLTAIEALGRLRSRAPRARSEGGPRPHQRHSRHDGHRRAGGLEGGPSSPRSPTSRPRSRSKPSSEPTVRSIRGSSGSARTRARWPRPGT